MQDNFKMKIIQLPVLTDNYTYLVICRQTGLATCIDSPNAPLIRNMVKKEGITLKAIWNTHHHWDHTGANQDLLSKERLEVYASNYDQDRIYGITHPLMEGDQVKIGELSFKILFIPGHTLGHIAYYGQGVVFCGDTLFSGGCGRLFEGDPQMMVTSLTKLKNLPEETLVYCMHEYTEANLEFALTLEPNNLDLQKKYQTVCALREKNQSTIPSTIGEEKKYNPFLRWDSEEIIQNLKKINPDLASDPVSVFSMIRKLKDNF